MTEEIKTSTAQDTTQAETKTEGQATTTTAAADTAPQGTTVATETPKAPESYDLKIPDGTLLPDTEIERVKAEAKELGFSNDDAQELLELRDDAMKVYHKSLMEKLETTRAAWPKQAEADSEIGGVGGKDFGVNVETAKRAIEKFGSDELKKELDLTGFGNHPEFLRFCLRVGKAMSDDKLVSGDTGKTSQPKTAAEVFYGGTN